MDTLAEYIPGIDPYPPYLLVAITVFIEYGIFDVYNYFISGYNSFLVEPTSLAVPAMVILAVVGTRYIHDTYASAIGALRLDERDLDGDLTAFEGLLSFRVRLAATAVAWVGIQAFNVFVLGIGNLVEIDGIGLVIYGQFAFLLVYIPVLVEFGLSYLAVHFVVPRRLSHSSIDMFFHDPRKMGGFQPIGELLKRSYYLYTATLILYFIQTKGPVLLSRYTASPYRVPNAPIIEAVLSVGWLVGVGTLAYSMHRVHTLMKSQKDQRIRELERELTDVMDQPYDIREVEITDKERYDTIQDRLQHVRDTATYPTTFTMWSQIFVSALLPQALNFVV
ncbi:MAG: hypothetical protein ABEJ30_07935 [Halorientalis sp.]